MDNQGMRYVGRGESIIGVPARDLTHDEVMQHGGYKRLRLTALYVPIQVPAPSETKENNHDGRD